MSTKPPPRPTSGRLERNIPTNSLTKMRSAWRIWTLDRVQLRCITKSILCQLPLSDQLADDGNNGGEFVRRNVSLWTGSTTAPVEGFDMVRQSDTAWIAVDCHFKWIAFDPGGQRHANRKSDQPIVRRRRQHNRRSMAGLLSTDLGTEIDPDDVAPIWSPAVYQISLPTGGPQSVSG